MVLFVCRRLVAAFGFWIVATSAWAQSPSSTKQDFLAPAEIAAGITLQPRNTQRANVGLVLIGAVYATGSLGIVADADVYRDNRQPVKAALGGIRVRTPGLISEGKSRGRFYAQLLAGEQQRPGVPHRFAIQPGAGGDAYLGRRLLIHFEYDYRWMPGGGRDFSTGRLLWALGVQIGAHS